MLKKWNSRAAPRPEQRGVPLATADLLGGLLVLAACALVLLHSTVLP